jgi:soluble lytic murein transglycosylase
VEADIYRYVDSNGTIHFTNTPTTPRYQLFKKSKTKRRVGAINTAQYDHLIKEISKQYRINPALVKAVIKAESNFDPYAVSKKGARGLMQLMPATMKDLQVYNPFHPRDNINGGVKFLKQLLERFNNDLSLSLAAYNAGPNAVEQYEAIPPYAETQHYVKKVLNYFDRYRQEL